MQLLIALIFGGFSGLFVLFVFIGLSNVWRALVWGILSTIIGFCFFFYLVQFIEYGKDNTPECLAGHTYEQTVIVPMFTGLDSNNQPIYVYVPQVQKTFVCDREGLTPKQKRERR